MSELEDDADAGVAVERPFWRVSAGTSPACERPDSLAWSEHNDLALCCGQVVQIRAADTLDLRGIVRAPALVADAVDAVGSPQKKRRRGDSAAEAPAAALAAHALVCAPAAAKVGALCWAPAAAVEPHRCLLCVCAAHTTTVLDAPPADATSPNWVPAFRVDQLLGEHLGIGSGEAARSRLVARGCSWSRLFALGAERGAASFVALAGPELLALVAHTSAADGDINGAMHVALSLPPPAGGGFTSVRFGGSAATDAVAVADGCDEGSGGGARAWPSAGLQLLAGATDGAVHLRLLQPEDATRGGAPALRLAASHRVCDPDERPVHCLSSCDVGPASFAVVGRGVLVRVYRLTTLGAGAGSDTGRSDSLESSLVHVSLLGAQATSALCTPTGWYACALDGSTCRGGLGDYSADDADGRSEPGPLELPPMASCRAGGALPSRSPSLALESDTPVADEPQLFGLAASPCGHVVGMLQRVRLDSSVTTRFDLQWRLLLGVLGPPPPVLAAGGAALGELTRAACSRAPGGAAWPLALAGCRLTPSARSGALAELEAELRAQEPPGSEMRRVGAWQLLHAIARSAASCAAGGPDGADAAAEIRAIADRCAAEIHFAHVVALARAAASAGALGGADAARAQRAADWLVGEFGPNGPRSADAAARRALEAAKSADTAARGGRGATPARDACPVCARPVAMGPACALHRCERGHPVRRCWRCLAPVGGSATWRCAVCAAASCTACAPGALEGALDRSVGRGVCGLCASACRLAPA